MIKSNLKFKIETEVDKLSLNASLEINNEIVCIFGPSGSGKTTILNNIAGIINPKKGKISINNNCIFDHKKKINTPIRQRNIGYAFQDERLFSHMNVIKNLTFKSKDQILLKKIINIFNLENILYRKIKNLSGGEKKRISLGRSLIGNPSILLLDEPLSGVDEERKFIILNFIKNLSLKKNIPILYVTHNMNEAKYLSEKIFEIKNSILIKRKIID